uniref:Uncharacterized protein n=1 Tax=Chrysotila carterae TaxID=13221 RepID=A0A7S4FBT7_CHRCT|mmetsp:Transcript_21278/g.41514  ORF Transcript_21278/g.41514 Transcript_21278/m.41514 type:complete len:449 (-) Transcript_21278:902-2248(-)
MAPLWTKMRLDNSTDICSFTSVEGAESRLDILVTANYIGGVSKNYAEHMMRSFEEYLILPQPTQLFVGFDALPVNSPATLAEEELEYRKWICSFLKKKASEQKRFAQSHALFRKNWGHQPGVTMMLLRNSRAEHILMTELDVVFIKPINVAAILEDVEYANSRVTDANLEDMIKVVKFNTETVALTKGSASGPGICLFGKEIRGRTHRFTRTSAFSGLTHLALRSYYTKTVVPQLLKYPPQTNEESMWGITRETMKTVKDFIRWGGTFKLGAIGETASIHVLEHGDTRKREPIRHSFFSVKVIQEIHQHCKPPGPVPTAKALAYSEEAALNYLDLSSKLLQMVEESGNAAVTPYCQKLQPKSSSKKSFLIGGYPTSSQNVPEANALQMCFCRGVCGPQSNSTGFDEVRSCQKPLLTGEVFSKAAACQCLCSEPYFSRLVIKMETENVF